MLITLNSRLSKLCMGLETIQTCDASSRDPNQVGDWVQRDASDNLLFVDWVWSGLVGSLGLVVCLCAMEKHEKFHSWRQGGAGALFLYLVAVFVSLLWIVEPDIQTGCRGHFRGSPIQEGAQGRRHSARVLV